MTTTPNDRSYYRALGTRGLLEAANYDINPDWKELAIALRERLQTKVEELEGTRYDLRSARSEFY